MQITALEDVRCPLCNGTLFLDEAELPITSYTTDRGQEIKEAFLHCRKCIVIYPVIAGVAILVPDALAYVADHYSTILSLASEHISSAMLDYFRRNAIDLIGSEASWTGSGSLQGMSKYIFAHYEDLTAILPASHPLHRLIGDDYGNWYEQLLQFGEPYLASRERALDIGCNVGGLVYRLAQLSEFVYGLDYSFCAVLTARRILLAQPYPQETYRLRIEGKVSYQKRLLSVERPNNVELVVASANDIPFDPGSFDIVTCANLIDAGPNPDKLLNNLYLMLQMDGVLITTDPYYWNPAHIRMSHWVGGRSGISSAEAMRTEILKRFTLLQEIDMVPWILRDYERGYQLLFNHHLVAQKQEM